MKKSFQFLLAAMCLALPGIASAQKTPAIPQRQSAHIKNIENNLRPALVLKGETYEKTITEVMKEDKVPGVSIAFVDNGKIAWVKCYGYADVNAPVKVNPHTVFLSGSISKPVTAVTALNLVEKGVLNLDKDVNLKLKGWKIPESDYTKDKKVTLRNLIDHKAGVTVDGNVFLEYDPNEKIPTVEQLLRGEAPSKNTKTYVAFEPGSKRKYSNAGYLVIQELLTDDTGQPFAKLVNDIVLKPSGMAESSFEQPIPARLSKLKALGYNKDGSARRYSVYPYMAPAGLWTTPNDLGKFMITLLNDYQSKGKTLLSQQMMGEMFNKNDARLGFSKIFYGDDVLFRHSGANDGFTCYMVGYAGRKQGLVIMTNSENGDKLIADIERAVAQEYNWEYLKPQVLNRYVLPDGQAAQYNGQFEWPEGKLVFKADNNKLFVQSDKTNNAFKELIPVAEHTFLLPSVPMKFTFLTENGQVNKVQITNENLDDFTAVKK